MKHDPRHTMWGVKIKREHKPWLSIIAYGLLLAVFIYGVIKLAEKYSGQVDWP